MNELEEIIRRMADALNAARASFQVWKSLRSSEPRSKRLRCQLNVPGFVDFIHAANSAHYKIIFLELGCLFDSDPRSASIRRLKEELELAHLQHLVQLVDDKLSSRSEIVKGIHLIRSRLIAHRDVGAQSDEIHKQAKIAPDMLDTLIKELTELLNEIAKELKVQPNPIVSITDRFADATYELGNIVDSRRS